MINPTLSIITVVRNGAATITECLTSVRDQTVHAEHIIIDACSTDRTLELVRSISPQAHILSEKDNGIYDAMNKGIRLARGEIIGILNCDDFYIDENVLSTVVDAFNAHKTDAVFADLVYVKPDNLEKIVRYYRGANFTPAKFLSGCMPPHPTLFIRRECYEKFGKFKSDYKVAGDFELVLRFMLKYKISFHYIPEVLVKMRTGGVSNRGLRSNITLNREILRACDENGVATNIFRVSSKYFTKWTQFFARPM